MEAGRLQSQSRRKVAFGSQHRGIKESENQESRSHKQRHWDWRPASLNHWRPRRRHTKQTVSPLLYLPLEHESPQRRPSTTFSSEIPGRALSITCILKTHNACNIYPNRRGAVASHFSHASFDNYHQNNFGLVATILLIPKYRV